MSIAYFVPNKPRKNDIVHIIGTGFDAVGSLPSSDSCATTNFNNCDSSTLYPAGGVGLCVWLHISGVAITKIPNVVSVTPTDIAIESLGIPCAQPVTVTVVRWPEVNIPPTTPTPLIATGALCTNNPTPTPTP